MHFHFEHNWFYLANFERPILCFQSRICIWLKHSLDWAGGGTTLILKWTIIKICRQGWPIIRPMEMAASNRRLAIGIFYIASTCYLPLACYSCTLCGHDRRVSRLASSSSTIVYILMVMVLEERVPRRGLLPPYISGALVEIRSTKYVQPKGYGEQKFSLPVTFWRSIRQWRGWEVAVAKTYTLFLSSHFPTPFILEELETIFSPIQIYLHSFLPRAVSFKMHFPFNFYNTVNISVCKIANIGNIKKKNLL